MMMKAKKIIMPIAILIILVAIAIFVSATKFKVENPLAVLNGLYQIAFTDTEYIEIQDYPKVILAKPQSSLENYMKEHGYTENKEEQLGAIRMFEREIEQEFISWSVNEHYSLWQWRE